MTDDNTGQPLGQGYLTRSTSAGNALVFRDPASMYSYTENPANAAQMNNGIGNDDGDFNTEYQQPAQS